MPRLHTDKQELAANVIAHSPDMPAAQVANIVGVDERSIYRYKERKDFQERLDELNPPEKRFKSNIKDVIFKKALQEEDITAIKAILQYQPNLLTVKDEFDYLDEYQPTEIVRLLQSIIDNVNYLIEQYVKLLGTDVTLNHQIISNDLPDSDLTTEKPTT